MVSIARSATQNALCDALRASWNKSGLRKPCFTVPVSFVSLCPSEPLVTCSCPMLLSCCCLSGLTCSHRRFYLLFRRNKRDERVPSVSGGNIGKWGRVRQPPKSRSYGKIFVKWQVLQESVLSQILSPVLDTGSSTVLPSRLYLFRVGFL